MPRFYALLILFAALLAFFFHHRRSWNADSRLLTVYALTEEHSLAADSWKSETGDIAFVNGHAFSDKAPMTSFLALPFYAAWRALEHHQPQTMRDREAGNHFGIVIAASIPFGIFLALLFARVNRRAASPAQALWISLAAAFGSCLVTYAGMFYGHMLAVMFFIAGYALAVDREEHFFLAGFLGGCAVLTEYTLVLTQIALCIYLCTGPSTRRDRARRLGQTIAGAAPCALAMLLYNRAVTGRLFDFPYSHVSEKFAPMQTAFGIRLPDLQAAWELLFGQYRGLAFYAPTLLLFVPLIAARFDGGARRRALVLILSAAYVLFISSYFKWDGGWCTGPRHLAPVIALCTYEGAGALAAQARFRIPFALLALFGALVAVCSAAADSTPPENVKAPAFEIFFPKALLGRGDFSEHALLVEAGLHSGPYLIAIWFALFVSFGAILCFVLKRIPTTDRR